MSYIAALAPFVVLRGNYDAANLPQSAFIQVAGLGLLLSALVGHRPGLQLPREGCARPLLACLLWAGVSLLWAGNPHEGLPLWLHWAGAAVWYVLAWNLIREPAELDRLAWALFASGLGVAAIGIAQQLFGLRWIPQAVPPAATFVNANIAAQYVVAVLPLALVAAPASAPRRILAAIAAAAMLLFLAFAATRSAWLALGAEAVLLAAFRRHLPRLGRREASAALAILLVVAVAAAFALRRKAATVAPLTTLRIREAVWLNTLAMARDHPLVGVGLGNHKILYPHYSRRVRVDPQFSERAQLDYVHDDYLQVAAELGLVGIVLGGWLATALVRAARRALATGGAPSPVPIGFVLSIAGLAVDAVFSFPMERALPPMLLAMAMAVLDARAGGRGVPLGRARPAAILVSAAALVSVLVLSGRAIAADRHCERMIRAERSGDWPRVLAEAAAAHRLDPHRPEPLRSQGAGHLASRRPAEAIGPLTRLLAGYPYDLNGLGNLGIAYAGLGDRPHARETFARVLAIKPDEARVHFYLAQLAESEGQWARALEEYRQAVRGDEPNPLYQYRLGIAAMQVGAFAEARSALERAVQLQPLSALAHKALGVLLVQVLRRPSEGLPHLRRALELDPRISDAEQIRRVLEREKPAK
ncbi:MAG TPA: O-antigen ligase family protein [Vicinamibacteria bacterium]|nr:O-antigen ligase family protein [Vicinamibacteria bacterium]